MTRVLTVIPCLNEAGNLPRLLDQMLADPAIGLLVVADGGSRDGSRELIAARAAEEPRLRLLDNPDRIQSAGINRAVAHFGSDFEWLLRIDAHCHYPDGYCAILLRSAAAHDATSVVVPMLTQGEGGFQDAVAAAQNSVLGTGGSPHRHLASGRYVEHGHHALMRLDLFRKVGGYCEAMPCNEDAEIDHRLIRTGGRIWLEPAAAIIYFPRSTPGALWRQYFRYGIGRARNMRRHRMRPALRQLVPLAVPLSAALAAFAWVHWIFAVPLLVWLVLVIGAGSAIGLQKGGGWALLSGVAAGIMQFAWACGFIAEWLRRPAGVKPLYGLMERTPGG